MKFDFKFRQMFIKFFANIDDKRTTRHLYGVAGLRVRELCGRGRSAGNRNASKAATVAAERLVECAKQKGSE